MDPSWVIEAANVHFQYHQQVGCRHMPPHRQNGRYIRKYHSHGNPSWVIGFNEGGLNLECLYRFPRIFTRNRQNLFELRSYSSWDYTKSVLAIFLFDFFLDFLGPQCSVKRGAMLEYNLHSQCIPMSKRWGPSI